MLSCIFPFIVAVDSSGNVFLTGSVSGGLDSQANTGNADIALLKYSPSGVWQWTQLRGTTESDVGRGGTLSFSALLNVLL